MGSVALSSTMDGLGTRDLAPMSTKVELLGHQLLSIPLAGT
jgi:hypothetical protein